MNDNEIAKKLEPIKYRDVDGNVYELPAVTLKKTMRLTSRIAKLIEGSKKAEGGIDFLSIIGDEKNEDTIYEMIEILTEKDRDFVENKIEFEEVAQIIIPFLLKSANRINQIVDKIIPITNLVQ